MFREADAAFYARMTITASPCRLSVANLLETSIVAGRRGNAADTGEDFARTDIEAA